MKSVVSLSVLLLFISCFQVCADTTVEADPDLPQPLDPAFAESLVMQSPFTRSVNLEESLQLTGVAYVDGRPVATVLNRTTKESFLVSEVPNAQGWRLTGLMAGADLSNTQIEMMVGPEVITMHYGGQQLSPGTDERGNPVSRLAKNASGREGEKFKASIYLGQRGKELYSSLSAEGRNKFRDLIKSHVEKRPELTTAQNEAYAKKVFAKIKETDQGTGNSSSSKTSKNPKPVRKKQGT